MSVARASATSLPAVVLEKEDGSGVGIVASWSGKFGSMGCWVLGGGGWVWVGWEDGLVIMRR